MKRIRLTLLLTVVCAGSEQRDAQAQNGRPVDVEITELSPFRNNVASKLCPGSGNAIRVGLTWHGAMPARPVSLRLMLTLPGAAGTLVSEGSVTLRTDSRVTTFTFLHVEVPVRMRGRGAQLSVLATADPLIAEPELRNNARQLSIDAATDWTCQAHAGRELQAG